MLHNAGFLSLSESLTNKKPTGLLLKNLAQAPERLTAWGDYKLAHGIGNGRTIPWVYWFDFLHGGAQGHAALSLNEGEAPPPLILDDDDLKVGMATAGGAGGRIERRRWREHPCRSCSRRLGGLAPAVEFLARW